ncbi:hypothetical protein D081_0536 [Anaerovibrio sp. JC8]|uniref:hypothetical protein n=1 Tax=Anaerovibrio sp. JC8 TaxID=1240085 RepID=UPI000A0AFE33|nr:hypothetical protein [Anaerovibrio sp. JC8]ORU01088.1 hypothetical protein D081_0536 [Anaerovibrio sp. JC8]
MKKIFAIVFSIFVLHNPVFAFTPPSNWICVSFDENYPVSIYINPSIQDNDAITFSLGDTEITGIEYIVFNTPEGRRDFLSKIPGVGNILATDDNCALIRAWVDYVYDPTEGKLYKKYNSMNFFDYNNSWTSDLYLRDLGLDQWGGVIEGLASWKAFFGERDFLISRRTREAEIHEIKKDPSRWGELYGEYKDEMIKKCEMSWSGRKDFMMKLDTYNENDISKTIYLDVSSINPTFTDSKWYKCWIMVDFSPPMKITDELYAKDMRFYTIVDYSDNTISTCLIEINPSKGKWQKEFLYQQKKLGESKVLDCIYHNLKKGFDNQFPGITRK